MEKRVYNFNAGPAALPLSVLEQAQAELINFPGVGLSILEMSHRTRPFEAINAEAEARLKRLLGLEEGYRVLFMQGGASTQFALLPMNFLRAEQVADYVLTGVWSDKAIAEAKLFGGTHVAASTKDERYRRVPRAEELTLSERPAYVHLTSNNTIYGTQWHEWPDVGAHPLVVDMSSDILSRRVPAERFAMIYAGAQKNIGPAGVTVVVLRESWLAEAKTEGIPTIFRYQTFADNDSLYNTPPVFAIYLLNLVLGWIEEQRLDELEARNQRKARLIYDALDESGGFYRGHAEPESRSLMNLTFRLPDETLEKQFVAAAEAAGMVGLAGHRSVGGIRASLYNATTLEACEVLAAFMRDFARRG